jgi:LysM repeat protein
LQADSAELTSENKMLKEDNADLERVNAKLITDNKFLRKENVNVKADATKLIEAIKALKKENADVKNDIAALKEQVKEQAGPGDCACSHTIVQGDTFYQLGVDRGFTVDQMQACNYGVTPTMLSIGQKIKMPCRK